MRRLVSWAVSGTIVAFAMAAFAGPVAAEGRVDDVASGRAEPVEIAQAPVRCPNAKGCVRAVTVNGLIDEINVDFISRAVRETEGIDGYLAVVLVVNSPGAVVDDRELATLAARLRSSTVPVSAWIGPSGSEARGGAAELVASIPFSMAPDTRLGDVGTPRLDGSPFDAPAASTARMRLIGEKAAVRAGLAQRVDPTLGDHVLGIKGVPSKQVKDDEGRPKREIAVDGVTQKLPVTIQLLHTAASPGVAYLALGIAIGLLLFEFFTAGVGVAGVVGAAAAVMAGYGLGELPIHPWALVLCLFAAFAFAIDIQTAIPRVWTAIGLISWVVGSFFLFDGYSAPWLSLITGIGGMGILMISGMPAMVRSRFATPTLGRDWMIGRSGRAITAIDPEGTVEVEGGQWRAMTNRATPVAAGDPVRVVSIDGLTLEVEPPEGGAIDYRERRSKAPADDVAEDAAEDAAGDAAGDAVDEPVDDGSAASNDDA